MNDENNSVLYSIIILAVIGISAVFIAAATQKRSMHMPKQQAQVTTPTSSALTTTVKKKKNCSCCLEKLRALRIQMQKAREAEEFQEVNQKSHAVSPL